MLLALQILAVIATFTIPKVLNAQQNQRNLAIAKEAIAAVSNAFQRYQLSGQLSSNSSIPVLEPYFNYVRKDTASTLTAPDGPYTCDSGSPCLVLASGGHIMLWGGDTYNGTSPLHFNWVLVDPDGTGSTQGVWFLVYYNGRITSYGSAIAGSVNSSSNLPAPDPANDPSWFNW